VQSHDVQITLTGALGTTGPQLLALVGAGGKTTALQRLCAESAEAPGGILATTTTAMFARQLSSVGPLLVADEEETTLAARAGEALRSAGVVSLARSRTDNEKVKGLSPAEVDALWRGGVAGSIFVEADGSRGLPLKAFGAAEPQVPYSATTVVLLAGLDALGRRIDTKHVHRSELLASALGVTRKTRVTTDLLSGALALQVVKLRTVTSGARVVVLLNKADDEELVDQGVAAGEDLLSAAVSSCGQPASGRPDSVVVGSLHHSAYHVLGEETL
jgi:probable selenium-dependent hydroxylase accessory protein YqeC